MADNRIKLLNEISEGLSEIRGAINRSNVNMPEDTPLQDYPTYIEQISDVKVDIGKQLFVFYAWAQDVNEARGFTKPSINWNYETNDGWIVSESDEWHQDVPDNPSNLTNTYYTFVMFVSLQIGDSTSDGFIWPTPVQVSGSKGEQGEQGNDGKDGVVAGLILNSNINLYSTSPDVTEEKLKYNYEAYQKSDSYELTGNYLIYDGVPVTNWSAERNEVVYLTYPEINSPVYTLTVKVSSDKEDVKIIYGPICQTITDVVTEYSNDCDKWFSEGVGVSKDNKELYSRTKTYFGTNEKTSEPALIAKYPNEIAEVAIAGYGVSHSTEVEPSDWGEMPDMSAADTPPVLWIKLGFEDTDGTDHFVNIPVSQRGDPGIPYKLAVAFDGSVAEETVKNWVNRNIKTLTAELGRAYKWGSNVYMYIGSNINMSGYNQDQYERYYANLDNHFFLKLGSFGLSKVDWSAKEGEQGYIENRTHYSYNIVEIVSDNDNPTCDIPENTKSFIITDANNNVITDCAIIGNILHINSGFTFPYTVTFKTYKQLDPNFVPQMIEIAYTDLKNLRDTNQLIPGMKYRITDYETTTIQQNTSSAGHQFDIIVTALDEHTLSEEVSAIQNRTDSYFDNRNLAAWKIWYSLDNKYWVGNDDKTIYYYEGDEISINKGDYELFGDMYDSFEVSAHIRYPVIWYDDEPYTRGLPFDMEHFSTATSTGSDTYVFDEDPESIEFTVNPRINYIFNGMTYHPVLGYTTDSSLYDFSEYDLFISDGASLLGWEKDLIPILVVSQKKGKGTIYRMIDEFGNDFPFDFQNIMIDKNPIMHKVGAGVETFSPYVTNNVCKITNHVIPDVHIYFDPDQETWMCSNNLIISPNDYFELARTGRSTNNNVFINCCGTFNAVNNCEFRGCDDNYENLENRIYVNNKSIA